MDLGEACRAKVLSGMYGTKKTINKPGEATMKVRYFAVLPGFLA
jgi:hypothetical protein